MLAPFTPDGTKAVIGGYHGDLIVFDVEMLLSGADVEDALDLEIQAHQTLILRGGGVTRWHEGRHQRMG